MCRQVIIEKEPSKEEIIRTAVPVPDLPQPMMNTGWSLNEVEPARQANFNG